MENRLIKAWKEGAKKIYDSETVFIEGMKEYGKEEKRFYTFQYLAQRQLNNIEDTKRYKTKTLEEQCNEEQLECINYLKQVILTGEL